MSEGIMCEDALSRIDDVLSRINSAREEAPSRRQALVDETRALRSLEPEARPARIGSVMKVFQKHVDWLTERAKLAEDALLEQQQLLFGQCMLEENGSSAKCSELQVSIAALQEALGVGGRVVSTAGLK